MMSSNQFTLIISFVDLPQLSEYLPLTLELELLLMESSSSFQHPLTHAIQLMRNLFMVFISLIYGFILPLGEMSNHFTKQYNFTKENNTQRQTHALQIKLRTEWRGIDHKNTYILVHMQSDEGDAHIYKYGCNHKLTNSFL